METDLRMEENTTKNDWFGRSSPKLGKTTNSTDVTEASTDDVSVDVLDRNLPSVSFNKYDMYYDMSGEKYLIIFNHYQFEKTRYFEYSRPPQRNYTEKDVKSLTVTFQERGFKITVHHDLKHIEILKKMSEVCKKDHRSTSCVAVAILSHGDDGGVFASDRPYLLSDVTKILQDSAGLVGKPKLLFVQACRGENMDDGRRVQTDGKQSIILPTHADTLIMYATVEDFVAYRDSNGSWMMQSLCEVLNKYHDTLDLLQMITLVHQEVAYKSSYTKDPKKSLKKLMPETKFTLTKLVKF